MERRYERNNPITSEEKVPALCPEGTLKGGLSCAGKYCDNVRLKCVKSRSRANSNGFFTRYFSVEYDAMMRCPSRTAVAGVSCKSKYCDNIALYCVKVKQRYRNKCATTKAVSEENGGKLEFSRRKVPIGMQCFGESCDNNIVRICKLTSE